MAWDFLYRFADELVLTAFTLDDFVQALTTQEPNTLANEIHMSLLQVSRFYFVFFSNHFVDRLNFFILTFVTLQRVISALGVDEKHQTQAAGSELWSIDNEHNLQAALRKHTIVTNSTPSDGVSLCGLTAEAPRVSPDMVNSLTWQHLCAAMLCPPPAGAWGGGGGVGGTCGALVASYIASNAGASTAEYKKLGKSLAGREYHALPLADKLSLLRFLIGRLYDSPATYRLLTAGMASRQKKEDEHRKEVYKAASERAARRKQVAEQVRLKREELDKKQAEEAEKEQEQQEEKARAGEDGGGGGDMDVDQPKNGKKSAQDSKLGGGKKRKRKAVGKGKAKRVRGVVSKIQKEEEEWKLFTPNSETFQGKDEKPHIEQPPRHDSDDSDSDNEDDMMDIKPGDDDNDDDDEEEDPADAETRKEEDQARRSLDVLNANEDLSRLEKAKLKKEFEDQLQNFEELREGRRAARAAVRRARRSRRTRRQKWKKALNLVNEAEATKSHDTIQRAITLGEEAGLWGVGNSLNDDVKTTRSGESTYWCHPAFR